MTKTTEEIILQELFNLNHKIDKFQDEVREKMATKEDLKREVSKLVTKEEFKKEIDKMVTKEEFKSTKEEFKKEIDKMVTKEEFKKEIDKMVTKEEFKKEIDKMVMKEEFKSEMDVQAKDIAQIFHDTFRTLEKREKQLELRLLKQLDKNLSVN